MSSYRLSVRYVMFAFITTALASVLGGCASHPNVSWDYNPSVSLNGLRYYTWYPDDEAPSSNNEDYDNYDAESLTQERIESAINMVLSSQGYREINSRRFNNRNINADFYVHASYDVASHYQAYPAPGYYGSNAPYGWSGAPMNTGVRSFQEGTLTIDIVNPETNQVIWSGKSWSRVGKYATPQQRTAQITSAVQKILSGFPRPHSNQRSHHSPHHYHSNMRF